MGGLRKKWKRVRDGLLTVLGIRRLGFFIPFRHAASVPTGVPAYAAIEAVFAPRRAAFSGVLSEISAEGEMLATLCDGPLQGHWNGGYFGPLDTAAAVVVVRRARPRQIVEVGSGSSTHVLAAASATLDAPAGIRCIDPAPRREISALPVRPVASVLTGEHIALFDGLEAGDIAFFDSSHVLFEGTDVDIIQNRILPVLRPGVLVHIHDIFLPDPYPDAWDHRAYTEQCGLGGWLCGGAYRVIFSSHYAATRMLAETEAALSVLPPHGSPGGGSLWLERL